MGHAFVCNCVNPHLFQVIQGAHYEPWRGRESSRFAYQRIDTIADHLHFVGLSNVRQGLNSAAEDAAGGGHAHCGTMIYLGDALPAPYRNTLMTNNIHGRRINNDIPRRSGSGYVASHGPDVLRAEDPWFMGVTLAYGASGEIYVSDWSDTGECHSIRNTRRHTGRIYRLTYEQETIAATDMNALSNEALVDAQLHPNDWRVRHARRLLQERFVAGQPMDEIRVRLREFLKTQTETAMRLRALWALHCIDGDDDELLEGLLSDADENLRSWAITLLCEDRQPPVSATEKILKLATSGDSALVRLSITSALQRLPLPKRWSLIESLSQRDEDIDDQNLPLMLWYAAEPLIDDDASRYAKLAVYSQIPLLSKHIARRIASSQQAEAGIHALLAQVLSLLDDRDQRTKPVLAAILDGLLIGLEGRRLSPPTNWSTVSAKLRRHPDSDIRQKGVRVALLLNDPQAIL
ncbi:MAG: hypothetical protein R3C05_28100, partial [Pirellulaceae bacterium]